MNVTFPTGTVNNLYTDIYSALTVDIESSLTDEEMSITTNTSSIRAFYTLAQGRPPNAPSSSTADACTNRSGSHFEGGYLSLFLGSPEQC